MERVKRQTRLSWPVERRVEEEKAWTTLRERLTEVQAKLGEFCRLLDARSPAAEAGLTTTEGGTDYFTVADVIGERLSAELAAAERKYYRQELGTATRAEDPKVSAPQIARSNRDQRRNVRSLFTTHQQD
jgi:hypothetical protein